MARGGVGTADRPPRAIVICEDILTQRYRPVCDRRQERARPPRSFTTPQTHFITLAWNTGKPPRLAEGYEANRLEETLFREPYSSTFATSATRLRSRPKFSSLWFGTIAGLRPHGRRWPAVPSGTARAGHRPDARGTAQCPRLFEGV